MDQNQNIWKGAVRRVVPLFVLEERDVILRLGFKAGGIYARLRFLDWFGVRRLRAMAAPLTSRNIVFVCSGNIMRSPIAEALFRDAIKSTPLAGMQVAS